MGGVPGLAIISFFSLIKAQSCLPEAPRGTPLTSTMQPSSARWPRAGVSPSLSCTACLGPATALPHLEWCARSTCAEKSGLKKRTQSRNSPSEDQRITVNYSESHTAQPHQRGKCAGGCPRREWGNWACTEVRGAPITHSL